MKKIFYLALFSLIFIATSIKAQTEVSLTANDSLIIEMEGYKQGNLIWQQSLNGTSWTRISGANDQQTLRQKVTKPTYFRSRIADGTCEYVYSDTIQVNINQTFSILGGRGYVESSPYVPSNGIGMGEKGPLKNWTDTSKKAVWFLYQKPGTYSVSFRITGKKNTKYDFEMNTSPAYDGLEYQAEKFNFSCTGTGGSEDVKVFTVTIPTTGYYRYELGAKSSMTSLTISELRFTIDTPPGIPSTDAPEVHTTDYLSSPSVHLGFSSEKSNSNVYDWLYEEILVPEGYDPYSTYYMSIGFFRGYMGIQTNSPTERRVLFSVWDISDRDKWPTAPKETLVSLVDKASYTQANSFGNEGTGQQSYVGTGDFTTWKTGTPVKFLMNCRRVPGIVLENDIAGVANKGDSIKHSVISAWFDANDGKGWRYIASWRTPVKKNDKAMFDGYHSFLENYGWERGQAPRKAYYYNTYAHELGSKEWIHLNRASYSNTDGGEGQRIDFEQGVDSAEPDKFYMLSGGYGQTVKTPTKSVPYIKPEDNPAIKNLDLTPFIERVNEALAKEAASKN
ncbi:DUF3472 domain-containing protein [Bacteroidales bacterium OttesenSCG-928-M06]|nr:DUF3472 domain-containing protein [Bacteroidales bacterium OttesenSCG-928-M06]